MTGLTSAQDWASLCNLLTHNEFALTPFETLWVLLAWPCAILTGKFVVWLKRHTDQLMPLIMLYQVKGSPSSLCLLQTVSFKLEEALIGIGGEHKAPFWTLISVISMQSLTQPAKGEDQHRCRYRQMNTLLIHPGDLDPRCWNYIVGRQVSSCHLSCTCWSSSMYLKRRGVTELLTSD